MDRLTKKRKTVRAATTKLFTKIEEDLKSDNVNTVTLEENLAQLQRQKDSLSALDASIEDLVTDNDLESELVGVETYNEKLTSWRIKLEQCLRKIERREDTSDSVRTESSGNVVPPTVKLPRLVIAKFYGDSTNWQSFWSQFATAIHNNMSLSAIDKFSYLTSFLGGAAATTIAGLAMTEANYEAAVKLLTDRFGRKDVIISAHMSNLLNITPVKNSNDTQALRKLYDCCEVQVRSLESLNVVSGSYSSLLCPILLKLIPKEIALEFNRQKDSDTDYNVTELLQLLRKEIESRERTDQMTNSLETTLALVPQKSKNVQFHSSSQSREKRSNQATAAALISNIEQSCIFCKASDHSTDDCQKLTLNERKACLKEQRRCYRCLRPNHTSKVCKIRIFCSKCNRRHHKQMCEESKPVQQTETQAIVASVLNKSDHYNTHTMQLQTAKAVVKGPNSDVIIRCLLDSGSQRSFIKSEISRNLNLPTRGTENLIVHAFGTNKPTKVTRNRVAVKLQNIWNPHEIIEIEAVETPVISGASIHVPSEEIKSKLSSLGLQISDDATSQTSNGNQINLIIGTDYYWKIVTGNTIRLQDSLVAIETRFGWSVHGPTATTNFTSEINVLKVVVEPGESELASIQLKRFWELDALGILDNPKDNVEISNEIINNFEKTLEYSNNRYKVKLPWKLNATESLFDNRENAERRLNWLSKRLRHDIPLYTHYDEVIKDYIAKGIVEEVAATKAEENQRPTYYMPHQPVYKQDRSTTKLRIVFDASSHSKGFKSLNDCLYSGPNLHPDLLQLLIKFRENRIAFTADAEKAFLQLELNEEDRDVTRFLWLDSPLCHVTGTDKNVKILRFTRVPFGITSSPFLLAATVKHHVAKYENVYPETCNLLNNSLYIDDLIGGADDDESANARIEETNIIMGAASLTMRKWQTNSVALRTKIQERDLTFKEIMEFGSPDKNYMQLKVLGISWNAVRDVFFFDARHLENFLKSRKDTKRFILQSAGRVFDPAGYLSPYTIKVKLLFQELWTEGVGWDEILPENVQRQWNSWCCEIKDLREIVIPRHYFEGAALSELTSVQVHAFSDASIKAYGAVVYIRAVTKRGKIIISLVSSKTRVAPIKRLTLPRLELLGALIAARLTKRVTECLTCKYTVHFWTDSTIVYYWIRSRAKNYKMFVENRINEIQALSDPENWSHCLGKDNPADHLTRGQSVLDLRNNRQWWEGPEWLQRNEACWPERTESKDETAVVPEELRAVTEEIIQLACNVQCSREMLFNIQNFSNLTRVLRITAWVIRFTTNLRNTKSENIRNGNLTAEEIRTAENYWIKITQENYFLEEIKCLKQKKDLTSESKLFSLAPFLDKEGIVRVGGRLRFSELRFENKHPAILPNKSKLTELEIDSCHIKCFHGGVTHTLTQIRQKIWIPKGRQAVKRQIGACLVCKRFNAKPAVEVTAPLPNDRINKCPPFSVTGIDFAGPLYVKSESSHNKAYIALFTCAVTRGIHLELVSDLSTEKFLLALRRFIARRGTCSTIISDNAKTFRCAEKELKRIWETTQNSAVQDYLANSNITWKNILERSPWWGGFYERLVRTVKTTLRKVLGKAYLNFEELGTLLSEVEAAVNSRPLTYMYAEACEPEPLTPAHFLVGNKPTLPPENPLLAHESSTKTELTRRVKYRRELLRKLWKTWTNQYLLELRSAHHLENPQKHREIKINEIVLIGDEKRPRTLWKRGLVLNSYTGRDGKVRSYLLRTENGVLIKRPIQLLYPLELQCEDEM